MNLSKPTFALLVALVGVTCANAQLVLNINTSTQEFALTGSDSGSPNFESGGGAIRWKKTSLGGSGDAFIYYDNAVAFSTSVGTVRHPGFNNDISISSSSGFGGSIDLALGVSSGSTQLITGSGVYQSYAGFTTGALARFEALIGETLSLNTGSDFGTISVVGVSAVPEPSTAGILVGAVIFAATFSRRRRLR